MDRRQSRLKQEASPSELKEDRYPLPQDSQRLVKEQGEQCFNYSLRLDRLLSWDNKDWKLTESTKEREGIHSLNGDENLRKIVAACKMRWQALLQAYRMQGYAVETLQLFAASRVVVGLGAESVLETSIRLHRLYGFPIIPASALKGLARSYAELIEGKDESDPIFAAVFGKSPPKAQIGKVIFLDAVPASSEVRLELDVMNPHYAPYYQNAKPPADYHSPVPVFFLTIAPESAFCFAVVAQEQALAQQASTWLRKGLEEMGIGAKTTSGYGLWKAHAASAQVASEAEEAQQEATPLLSSPKKAMPPSPPISEKPPRKGDIVGAQVLDNSRKPIQVRLLVKGYENSSVACAGVGNLESFPPGTYIRVEITQMKGDHVQQVSVRGIWRASNA
ncbi:hypothetical protein HRbin18_01923 [bacterium HR18]|nr:hypothetical protein HRbin18_01923 [bacterium HR18]